MFIVKSSEDFRRYAGTMQDRWDLLKGAVIEHATYGIGVVLSTEVTRRLFTRVHLVVKFSQGEKRLLTNDLRRVVGLSFSSAVLMELRRLGVDISQLPEPDDSTDDQPVKQDAKEITEVVLGEFNTNPNWTKEIKDYQNEIPNQEIQTDESPEIEDAVGPTEGKFTDKTVPEDQKFSDKEKLEEVELPEYQMQMFTLGDIVCLRQNPAKTGIITKEPIFGEGEYYYEIFFSANDTRTIPERDLRAIPKEVRIGFDREFLRDLLVLKLKKPLEDNLYSAYASKTKFEVYQFKPALKFLRNADQRLLIADEVGLGKTIEAGIIYLELQARLDLPRVLVVCPSGLRYKWQDEFRSRFDEEFEVLDKERFQAFVHRYQRNGEEERLRGIISIELLRMTSQISAISNNNILFDLLIIDEAHHCRNSETLTNRMAMTLEEQSLAVLLLTATPLQTSNRDLFNLFRILNPGEFDEFSTFEDRLEPNQYITQAAGFLERGDHKSALKTLRKVERTSQGERFHTNPYFRDLVDLLSKEDLSKKELVYAQRTLLDLNTLSLLFTRTRKRDAMINPPVRTAEVIKSTFTLEEKAYYKAVVDYVRTRYMLSHPGLPVYTWTTMMKERQVASCITAFHRKFSGSLEAEDTASENIFADYPVHLQMDSDFINSSDYLKSLDELRKYLVKWKPPHDTKFDQFLKALKIVLEESPEAKVLVFSFFIDTVNYLREMLEKEGIKSLKMHGGYSVQERQMTIDSFRDDPKIRVLVSSDVGAEGLDFQFCDTLFNYDLPWNPMKVEQRIGRIDRFGQQSKRIRIYNMVIADTIEDRILYRLYNRIGLFKHAIGDIELILGEEINSLAQLVFSKDLTPQEEAELVERTARNIERREQDREEFERQRLQFMGQDVIFSNLLEQSLDAGGYISENELCAMVGTFVKKIDPHSHLDCNPEMDNTYTLIINDDLNTYIRHFILDKCKGDKSILSFLTRLRPGREMPLTFSSVLAYERKPLEFITARHPLAKCAYEFWRNAPSEGETVYKIRLDAVESRLSSEYHFFVYLLDMSGTKNSVTLHPVVVDPFNGRVNNRLSHEFINRIQKDIALDTNVLTRTALEQLDISQQAARRYILRVRNEQEKRFRKENEMFINARRFALKQSLEAKQKRIREVIEKLEEERVMRMWEGRLRNVKADYEQKMLSLDGGNEVSVSFTMAMRGFLVIENPQEVRMEPKPVEERKKVLIVV